jgi:hypothetical protein
MDKFQLRQLANVLSLAVDVRGIVYFFKDSHQRHEPFSAYFMQSLVQQYSFGA